MKTNPKVKYGKTNLLPEKIDPKDEMIMISIKMEGDLLDALKKHAKEIGRPYQTLMKEMLRSSLGLTNDNGIFPRDLLSASDISRLLQQMEELNKRVEHVEEEYEELRIQKKA